MVDMPQLEYIKAVAYLGPKASYTHQVSNSISFIPCRDRLHKKSSVMVRPGVEPKDYMTYMPLM